MKLLKKLMLPFATVIVIAGIGYSIFNLYSDRMKDNLHIEDISGDRSALQDISISGVLSDRTQQTSFTFANGQLTKRFSMVTSGDYEKQRQYNQLIVNRAVIYPSTEVDSDSLVKKVTLKQESNGTIRGEYRYSKGYIVLNGTKNQKIKTDVVVGGQMSIPFTIDPTGKEETSYVQGGCDLSMYANPVVEANGRKYVYTFTDTSCSGYGGVYDMTDYFKNPGVLSDVPNLAPVYLEDGKVQIEGLAAEKDRLMYLLVINRMVYIRPFNLVTNSFEKDIKVGPVPEGVTVKKLGGGYSYDEQSETIYDPFIKAQAQGDKLCLMFLPKTFADLGTYISGRICNFYVVDIAKGKLLVSLPDQLIDSGRVNLESTSMVYKNDTLFILQAYGVLAPSNYQSPKNCIKISAYKDGSTVYQGNIVSDAQDDFEYQNQNLTGNDLLKMRDYYFLSLS